MDVAVVSDRAGVAGDGLHVQPAHGGGKVMVDDFLALGARADGVVEVRPLSHSGYAEFVGQLVELLVVQRARLVDDDQVEVGAGPSWPRASEPTAAEADTRVGHGEKRHPCRPHSTAQ